jgi:hypothetical protein
MRPPTSKTPASKPTQTSRRTGRPADQKGRASTIPGPTIPPLPGSRGRGHKSGVGLGKKSSLESLDSPQSKTVKENEVIVPPVPDASSPVQITEEDDHSTDPETLSEETRESVQEIVATELENLWAESQPGNGKVMSRRLASVGADNNEVTNAAVPEIATRAVETRTSRSNIAPDFNTPSLQHNEHNTMTTLSVPDPTVLLPLQANIYTATSNAEAAQLSPVLARLSQDTLCIGPCATQDSTSASRTHNGEADGGQELRDGVTLAIPTRCINLVTRMNAFASPEGSSAERDRSYGCIRVDYCMGVREGRARRGVLFLFCGAPETVDDWFMGLTLC